EARYALLETVRQFANARLVEAGEAEDAAARHAGCFAAQVQELSPRLRGPEGALAMELLQRDWPNIRAALEWTRAPGRVPLRARIAFTVRVFWSGRGAVGSGGVV